MATFSNMVFNVYTQNPQRSGSLSAADNSVILEAGSPWDSTINVPVSVFNILSGAEVNALTSNPMFANQGAYWMQLSTYGFLLSSRPLTDSQYTILSSVYVNKPYLATRYASLTAHFVQLTATKLAGYNFTAGAAPEVACILFPTVTGTSSPAASATIYLPDGIKLRVHPNYQGQQFAVQFTDRSSCLFTVSTALSTGVHLLCASNFNQRSPEDVRRFALNG